MVSVISIAKNEEEFASLRGALGKQTFRDFEFITSTKSSIPEAWNDAIARARGEFLVFTETDAMPYDEHWLEEIVVHAARGRVLKGLEITPTELDLCNLVCDASILREVNFDETFKLCEDTELFARFRKMGINIGYVSSFPVIHARVQTWRKTLSRAVRIGMYFAKIVYLHGRRNIDDVNTRNFQRGNIHPVSNRLRVIVENGLVLFGLLVGAVRYFPMFIRRSIHTHSEIHELP